MPMQMINSEKFTLKRKSAAAISIYFDSISKAQIWSKRVRDLAERKSSISSLKDTFAYIYHQRSLFLTESKSNSPILPAKNSSLTNGDLQHAKNSPRQHNQNSNSSGKDSCFFHMNTVNDLDSVLITAEELPSVTSSDPFDVEYYRLNWSNFPEYWRIFKNDFTIAVTYPKKFLVPHHFTQEQIESIGKFRHIGRIPTPTWKLPNKNIVLLRSSQPSTGLLGMTRNSHDENYFSYVSNFSYKNNPVAIVDCRSNLAAGGNRFKGGGFEHLEYYTSCGPINFLNLANIHSVRQSLNSLLSLLSKSYFPSESDYSALIGDKFYPTTPEHKPDTRRKSIDLTQYMGPGAQSIFEEIPNAFYEKQQNVRNDLDDFSNLPISFEVLGSFSENFLQELANTNWYLYISQILKGTLLVQHLMIILNQSCLVHCSDGWDRTSQICALAKLINDPFYRTLKGFIILIKTDWLNFGHKFADRNGTFGATDKLDERSPIFLQFLDCCYQLLTQFPAEFEFNENFLLKIAKHFNSGMFGDFFLNCDHDRDKEVNIGTKTKSIWSLFVLENEKFNDNIFVYKNVNFSPKIRYLQPSSHIVKLKIWRNLYLEFIPELSKLSTLYFLQKRISGKNLINLSNSNIDLAGLESQNIGPNGQVSNGLERISEKPSQSDTNSLNAAHSILNSISGKSQVAGTKEESSSDEKDFKQTIDIDNTYKFEFQEEDDLYVQDFGQGGSSHFDNGSSNANHCSVPFGMNGNMIAEEIIVDCHGDSESSLEKKSNKEASISLEQIDDVPEVCQVKVRGVSMIEKGNEREDLENDELVEQLYTEKLLTDATRDIEVKKEVKKEEKNIRFDSSGHVKIGSLNDLEYWRGGCYLKMSKR